MDEEDAPIPFVRNRQSRKSRRYTKGRRVSTESNSSADSLCQPTSTSSSSLQFSYSVNSQSESLAIKERALAKMESPLGDIQRVRAQQLQSNSQSDPSLFKSQRMSLDEIERTPVKTLRQKFEELNGQEQIIFKTPTYKSTNKSGWREENNPSIDEAATEDELDGFSDNDENNSEMIPDIPPPIPDSSPPRSTPPLSREPSRSQEVEATNIDVINAINESGYVNAIQDDQCNDLPVESRNTTNNQSALQNLSHDFPRNYRSEPRRKTEIIAKSDQRLANKSNLIPYSGPVNEDNEEAILREKCDKIIQPILDELIKTEESYVENLFMGISNYGNIFSRKDLPPGLRGKKYVLIGNVEQIAEFHRDEFLPMLLRNKDDLIRLFDEFSTFIDENCFYGYVLFTMNKKRSLKLCELHKEYFKHLQSELNDKLGVNSFLVQPIQRMARYPLLLQQFEATLSKHYDSDFKSIIESCGRLKKKMLTLLTMTNESEVINDIVESNDFNVTYQGKFRKVSEFIVFDHSLRRGYRSKVFIFEKCVIYTEIKEKRLIFRGCYPCDRIGTIANKKTFTLFYQRRKTQECDFSADPAQCKEWLELITEMISSFAKEERRKLKEKYSKENDHAHRRPPSLSRFRNSNRFSSDSGIGNMWSMPKAVDDTKDDDRKSSWYNV